MALPAQPRPDMPPPQPTESTDVSYPTSVKRQPAHLFLKKGETGDQVFKIAMLLCGLAVLGTLVLIVYELVLRSGPSWHAFGFKFFAGRDWDPVNEKFGALPFIYGTLVSSLLALIIAVPLS
ncbi:MAG: phosphate ABC transporter permease subunit PstC, partial [Candidatus Sulfotelmatobacter sp.]